MSLLSRSKRCFVSMDRAEGEALCIVLERRATDRIVLKKKSHKQRASLGYTVLKVILGMMFLMLFHTHISTGKSGDGRWYHLLSGRNRSIIEI